MAYITAKVTAVCLILAVSMQMCCGSAIPIWEFLTRNEKIGYLYSQFAQLVSIHCKATAVAANASPVNHCKRDLLSYGYERLQTFHDAQLDALDPYQKGANELIWSSIMREHPSSTLITTRHPLPTPPASSIIILTHQKPDLFPELAAQLASSIISSSEQFGRNPLFEHGGGVGGGAHNPNYAMNMDNGYRYPSNDAVYQQQQTATTQVQPKTYLSGPLVFRVRPDGTPVEEDQHKQLPRDDDFEAFPVTAASGQQNRTRPNKHRKIASISSLKQQHLATMALQRQLMPPYERQPQRRKFEATSYPVGGYIYGRA